jgi:hypothetical protein
MGMAACKRHNSNHPGKVQARSGRHLPLLHPLRGGDPGWGLHFYLPIISRLDDILDARKASNARVGRMPGEIVYMTFR